MLVMMSSDNTQTDANHPLSPGGEQVTNFIHSVEWSSTGGDREGLGTVMKIVM